MKTITALRAAGDTHPGLHREVNEDRFHLDLVRGLFIVVDGIGGQAAGGKAADVAMGMLRARLERETGTVADRVREAITVANNEIRRVASLRPEWHGMACVLTVAVVEDGKATVGHVGDTRLYKLRRGRIEKATRDHSPVGEREDAREISELEAMRHPRRNEVYRDVGSESHDALDPDFIDLDEIPFEADAALLLCSDGLTDLVDSASIKEVVEEFAGRPHEVVSALIQAANGAGGKDNVTVVYVEGEEFAAKRRTGGNSPRRKERAGFSRAPEPGAAPDTEGSPRSELGSRGVSEEPGVGGAHGVSEARGFRGARGFSRADRVVRVALVTLLALVVGYGVYSVYGGDLKLSDRLQKLLAPRQTVSIAPNFGIPIVVTPSESIAAALSSAPAGATVTVEPGEYRERLVLRDGVRIVSRIARAAIIRLPSIASEGDPAVVADGVSGAELTGFRIVGDAATPLGTGIFVKNAEVSIVDVEITGAANVAVEAGEASRLTLLAGHIHDNPGAALAIRRGASSRFSQNVFSRNGLSERVGTALLVEPNAQPALFGNVFQGVAPDAFRALGDAAAARVARDNWFVDSYEAPSRPASVPRGRRGR